MNKIIKEIKMATSKNRNKRLESTKQYIDKLQENYSKLNIVRIDLSYKELHARNTTLEEANKDIERMFCNMRSKPSIFKDKVGYVCKREYTRDKGVHFHTIFIYDGQRVQKDTCKAEQIGDYWKQLTEDKGIFFSCNHQKKKYKKLGIGMLEHHDKKKRENLDDTISYLCKDEQDIEPIKQNKKSRAFTRGTTPKSKGNIGRPRN